MSLYLYSATYYIPEGSSPDVTVNDRSSGISARGGTETLVIDRLLSDRPSAVAARGGTETLAIDRFATDRPSVVQARGGKETISLVSPVNVADRPGTVSLAGPGQTLIVDRVFADRPGALAANGPGQIVLVDVIRFDRPGIASANNARTLLAGNVFLADRPGAASAVGAGQSVSLGDPLVGWPPVVRGPFREPLLSGGSTSQSFALSATPTGTPDATTATKGKLQLAGDLAGTASAPTVPGLSGKANTVHTHTESDVAGLVTDLAGKASSSHTHAQADVIGLVTALAGKLPLSTVTTKGDLVVGTGAGAVTRLPVTIDGQSPVTDTTQPGGWKLATPTTGAAPALRGAASTARLMPNGNTGITTVGVPNTLIIGLSTVAVPATAIEYAPFVALAAVTVEAITVECTVAPASAATVHAGIYRADPNQQPYGAPVADATLNISTTGVFSAPVEVPLTPGQYVTAIVTSVALTCRAPLGAYANLNASLGAAPGLATLQGPGSPGALAANPKPWTTLTYSATFGQRHSVLMQWRDTAAPILICDGDSLTWRSPTNLTYPQQLLSGLVDRPIMFNFGVAGQGVNNMASDAATQIDPVATTAAVRVLVAWGGTNDLGPTGGGSLSGLETAITNYCNARRAAGFKVVVVTLLPRGDGTPATQETARAAYNVWLRANYTTFADGLADVGADPTIGAAGAYSNTTYYDPDTVHLTDAGYGIVASIVRPAIGLLGIS